MSHDLHSVPGDLPVPEDDAAGDRLLNATIPSVTLPSTAGNEVNLAAAAAADGHLVVYVYPQTGVPGRPVPEGWDRIPGARGCTPQSCAFRDSAEELTALGASVYGLSAQPLGEQRDFAEREHLPYPLLNDSGFGLAHELELPTFEANGIRYYCRLTFVARAGRIVKVFYPVFPPQDNAGDVIDWLRGGLIQGRWTTRAVERSDRDAWKRLFAAYCDFYGVELTEEHLHRVWSWIEGGEVHAILAFQEGSGDPAGLAHIRPWVRPLRGEVAGYLDDLFVDPAARGSGAVNALFDGIQATARQEGWRLVRWATAPDNHRARRAYERVAARTDWVTYDMSVSE